MNYLIAIDTGRRIYTHDLKPGDTASIGDSRDDKPQVIGYGLGASYLVLSCDAGGVQVISRRPMKFGTNESITRGS